ncbi:MAG TPA: class I SAM-dependent methyltransferase [Acidimicrobiia bacterium]|nr:class I SAM-dependent methyltransferase [Acidimicrobiia bacterium]
MPTTTSTKELVSAGYDAMHGRYADWAGRGPSRRKLYLLRAARMGLLKPGDALDLGCGTGRHATAALAAAGFRVTGLDVSAQTIEAARRELPSVRFVVGDMASVDFPPGSFDLVTAFYSIVHLPREEHGEVLRRVAGWLRPGGGFIASLGAACGDAYDEDWLGVPMYWSSWDHRTNRRLVSDTGLQILVDTVETTLEDGQPVAFQWLIACKPSAR